MDGKSSSSALNLFGVHLHAWGVEAFHMLGNCIGHSLEVDRATLMEEELRFGHVKIKWDGVKDTSGKGGMGLVAECE